MGFINSIQNFGHRVYNFLTDLRVVKYGTLMGLIIFISAILIGIIVAQFDPDGYNIIDNYISDMGSINHTPYPFILDFGNMISSILFIPSAFYLEKKLAPLPQNPEELRDISRMRLRLSSYGVIMMLLGFIGMFGTGLFSEDRSTILNLHWLFTIVVFVGLAMTGFFFGLLIVFYNSNFPKLLGIYMILGPSVIAGILFSQGFQPLHEWIMLGSLFMWIIPSCIISVKNINQELK